MRATVGTACVLLLCAGVPGAAMAQSTEAIGARAVASASQEIEETESNAENASAYDNCTRLQILRARLNDIRTDPNHAFWKRHGLNKVPRAYADQIYGRLNGAVGRLYRFECPRPTESASKLSLGAGFRYMDRFVGDNMGVGVVVTPGDPFFLKNPDRVDGWSAHLNAGYQDGYWRHGVGLTYSRSKSSTTASEPAGGRAIGYTPGDATLGAGANFGPFGASATSDVSLTDLALDYKLMVDFNADNGFNRGWLPPRDGERSEKRVGVVTSLRWRTLDHDGHLQRTPDPNNVYVNIDQSLKTFEAMIGPTIGGRRVYYNWSGLYIGASASLQGGFMRSTLNSTEQMCFACAGTPTYATINQTKTDFSYKAQLQGSVGFNPTSNMDIALTGSASYGTRHIIDTRQNPADTSTAIGLKAGVDWGIGARGRLRF